MKPADDSVEHVWLEDHFSFGMPSFHGLLLLVSTFTWPNHDEKGPFRTTIFY